MAVNLLPRNCLDEIEIELTGGGRHRPTASASLQPDLFLGKRFQPNWLVGN